MAQRKLGQFHVKVWFTDGARYEEFSNHNNPPEDFCKALEGVIERLQRVVTAERKRDQHPPDALRVTPGEGKAKR